MLSKVCYFHPVRSSVSGPATDSVVHQTWPKIMFYYVPKNSCTFYEKASFQNLKKLLLKLEKKMKQFQL